MPIKKSAVQPKNCAKTFNVCMSGIVTALSHREMDASVKPVFCASCTRLNPLSSRSSRNLSPNSFISSRLTVLQEKSLALTDLQGYYSSMKKIVCPACGNIITKNLAWRLSAPIEELGISNRLYNCLRRGQIEYVEQIFRMTQRELYTLRDFGVAAERELKARLHAFGIGQIN